MKNNLSKSTLVLIITFNPKMGLLQKNVSALHDQFEHILIVDNHSENVGEIELLVKKLKPKIILEKLFDNMGIAYAQNFGLRVAKKVKIDWLLLMDQDSIIPANLSSEYQKIINDNKDAGLVTWDPNSKEKNKRIIEKCRWIVSSGSLVRVSALEKIGGFDNRLFIDHVDTDINLKFVNSSIRTITTRSIRPYHELGDQIAKRTVRGDSYHKHSPIRVYYFIRNSTYLIKKNFFKQPIWMLEAKIACIREAVYLLHFQPNKLKNLFLISRAWFDGIFERLGKYQGK